MTWVRLITTMNTCRFIAVSPASLGRGSDGTLHKWSMTRCFSVAEKRAGEEPENVLCVLLPVVA
jgi:hypothetical protein